MDFSAKFEAMWKQNGTYSNIRQATAYKPVEMFFKFNVGLSPGTGDTACSRLTFRAMVNNLRLTNINGGRNKARRIIKNTLPRITKPLAEIRYVTTVEMSNIARRVSNLPLVTDVR